MSRKTHNKKPSTLVSVIIPVHRRMDLLKSCLAALPDAFGDIPFEIILIDNATPIEEKRDVYLELRRDPRTFIYESQVNMGFPKACNLGYQKSNSPLLFFLNSDVIMSKGSGELLVRKIDDPKIGVVGMLLIFPNHSDLNMEIRPAGKVQHVGLAINIQMQPIHLFIGWSPTHSKVLAMDQVPAVTGAALMTRRNLFGKAGKFFDGYKLGTFEDVDYCLTVANMGYNICVEPKAIAMHYTNATAEKYQISYPYVENSALFMQRWMHKIKQTDWEYW